MTGQQAIHLFGVAVAWGDWEQHQQAGEQLRAKLVAEINAARETGLSWGQIAAQMGTSRETPRMIASRAGRVNSTTESAPRAVNSGAMTQKETSPFE